MSKNQDFRYRFNRSASPSLRNWQELSGNDERSIQSDTIIKMGWGKLIFGHTFKQNEMIIDAICDEEPELRNIAFYLRDPHVLLSIAPDRLFLDPSHSYRLWHHEYRHGINRPQGINVRRLKNMDDIEKVNAILQARHMVCVNPDFVLDSYATRLRTYLVAESLNDSKIIGTVTGVDHVEAFNDPEKGASLWALAVDPQIQVPAVGQALVQHLVEHYFTRGRAYVDLSVMHVNTEAIQLYEKLGFQRVPVFCVKKKNMINETLYTPPQPEEKLNPYARIIIDEARRRGIYVTILDDDFNHFQLNYGGKKVSCWESLTDITSAIAMCRCDDKRLTHRILKDKGLNVPDQFEAGPQLSIQALIEKYRRLVVKPAKGEQGNAVSVDLRTEQNIRNAIDSAKKVCEHVIIEHLIEGEDVRIIVINYEVVAVAVRKPPVITGTGIHLISELIAKYNRRRKAATGGESYVPVDDETKRCIGLSGYSLDDILEAQKNLTVRKTANLHTGGTIHDITDTIHPDIKDAAVFAAQALEIPVVGLDFIVPNIHRADYVIIEANERPGLANHEPQPTAERFIDLLFPQSFTGN
ncbi:MAG: N-acetylglutaminylglutamine synthetase [Candidatus Magnetomorum sp.]|nr:N-acetylglutaminylglutamine synthetase [Candidatus Magnetomorum sp.]